MGINIKIKIIFLILNLRSLKDKKLKFRVGLNKTINDGINCNFAAVEVDKKKILIVDNKTIL